MARVLYQRILLKISGEFLAGGEGIGFQPQRLQSIARQIARLVQAKVQIGIVVGGGNLVRGRQISATGVNKVAADQMGMLATAINGIALRDALEKADVQCRLVSALSVSGLLERHNPRNVIRYLNDGDTVIYCGGTGNPFFTTDTAACLRAVEIEANILLKGTKVDGVYNKDPAKHADATKYERLGYEDAINRHLEVMDLTAITLASDHAMPVRIFSIMQEDMLLKVMQDASLGTLITNQQNQ